MPQIFHRSSNSIVNVVIVGVIIIVAGVLTVILNINRTPYISKRSLAEVQPVPFSHDHHVRGIGIDCRYCHASVETGSFAGIPATRTCMTCHSQIWTEAPMLEPVRESFKNDKPLAWVRIHDTPDFVYFNHSIHINKGVACVTCHGPVDRMPLMWKQNTLNMEWCINCHRHPERQIGPREAVFLTKEKGDEMLKKLAGEDKNVDEVRLRLAKEYNVVSKMDCSTCHR